MRCIAAVVLVMILAAQTLAAEPSEVDRLEGVPMGNVVQHIDGIGADISVDAFIDAMGPSASDADKWCITVLSTRGCAPCQKLKADWASSPCLLALSNPNDSKQSWAHYHVYAREDKGQALHFEAVDIVSYPTVLVQPPRSGNYGKPTAVVFQGGYGGDPKQLASQIVEAIRLHVAKFNETQLSLPSATTHNPGNEP